MKYPGLFHSADEASNRAQRHFLRLVRFEYFLLFVCAVFALGLSDHRGYYLAYTLAFLASMGAMILRSMQKPEQTWYRSRALAESVKTMTWRFAMRAVPFDDAKSADARADFRTLLQGVLETNKEVASVFDRSNSNAEQLPNEVQTTREFSLADRKRIYLNERVEEQRKWYHDKSESNRRAAKLWFTASIAAYVVGFFFILVRVFDPAVMGWPTEPFLIIAASIVGWTQIKKFNELAAAYSLTAQEIGLAEIPIRDAQTNGAFSAAVNEAELVFSREHTQWSARQHQGA